MKSCERRAGDVCYQRGRFRVVKSTGGGYWLEVLLSCGRGPWARIELYDYVSNAWGFAKKLHREIDGWTKLPLVRRPESKELIRAWRAFSEETFATNNAKGFGMPEGANIHWDGNQIALMHGELSEAHEGLRKNLMDDKLTHRNAVEVELADVVIRIMNYAKERNLDVAGAIVEKAAFNRTRPHMHGAGKQF